MKRTLTVRAFSFASTLSPKDLTPLLEKAGGTIRATKTQVVAECETREAEREPRNASEGSGGEGPRSRPSWVIAYDFGAVAFVDVPDEQRQAVLDAISKRLGPEPHPPLEEQATIEVDPDSHPSVRFDRVVVHEINSRLAELVALVVAQSAAMEYYEEDVDQILQRLKEVSERLAQTGKLSEGRRELLRFVGSGMSTHNQVIYTLSLLDTPQLAWEEETLDRLYIGLRTQFEIADRFRALDLKLRMIQDNFELFVDLTQERRNYALELIVAVLVAVEVVLFVYEIFRR